MKHISLILTVMMMAACGTDEQNQAESVPAFKNISLETVPSFYAERLEAYPMCVHACDTLLVKDDALYFCFEAGQKWIRVDSIVSGTDSFSCQLVN